jgi:hypothetical protein
MSVVTVLDRSKKSMSKPVMIKAMMILRICEIPPSAGENHDRKASRRHEEFL